MVTDITKDNSPSQEVRRRRVFYIPGYDPIHPRRYRELYRKEGTKQAKISGYKIDLKGRRGKGNYGWKVKSTIENQSVEAEFDVLVWSDIVRNSMDLNIAQTYLLAAQTAWTYIGSGALFRLMRLRKGPVIAALYPVGMLIIQLLLAIGLGWFLSSLVKSVLQDHMGAGLHLAVSVLIFGSTFCGVLRWFRKIDNKLFVYYLMHDYSYSARSKGANPPELENRMAEFADQIAHSLSTDVDEVLVVGHSSGAHIAVSILSDLLRDGRVKQTALQSETAPRLGFLSLGQVVPMVSFLPKSDRLRRDLFELCQQDTIAWVDVSAPGDGCAFALCDPVSVSGVAPDQGKRWPLVLSAAFTHTLSPARWKELRWRFFRLHFQYLCAFDCPSDYDYFQITAGPRSLMNRFDGRMPSKSRIETSVSKFTSMGS